MAKRLLRTSAGRGSGLAGFEAGEALSSQDWDKRGREMLGMTWGNEMLDAGRQVRVCCVSIAFCGGII